MTERFKGVSAGVLLILGLGFADLRADGRGEGLTAGFVANAQPEPLVLEHNPFGPGNPGDHDQDCLDDAAEYQIARQFRPYYVFDSRENARRPGEPLTLFRVKPILDYHGGCVPPANGKIRVEITYAMIFRDDGGYVSSIFCGDRHRGDNQAFRMEVEADTTGKVFSLSAVYADHYHWLPDGSGTAEWFYQSQYPVVYLSGGKHHLYFDSRINGHGSVYSNWGCKEAMDMRGVQLLTVLESPLVPHGILNVGEPGMHPASDFVGDLSALGFAGENAWGTSHFCGGQHTCGSETSSMTQMWGG